MEIDTVVTIREELNTIIVNVFKCKLVYENCTMLEMNYFKKYE
jgi:hypothetical protein